VRYKLGARYLSKNTVFRQTPELKDLRR
jgi:hypothetical protein